MEDTPYQSFLRQLDDSELIDHISELSQETDAPAAISTPRPSSVLSDPFNDGLDSQLLRLGKQPSLSSLDGVPPNQLAVLNETDADSSDDEDLTPVGPLHQFGDYATYFQNKHAKQQNADAAFVQWEKKRLRAMGKADTHVPFFSGCVIFVNGNTTPSLAVIHRLVVLHGGKFLSYLVNKGAATHIICDRLTPRKRIEFRNYKVVRAKWISDCVEQGRLLDWREYRLIDNVEYCQKRLAFDNIEATIPHTDKDKAKEDLSDDMVEKHNDIFEIQDEAKITQSENVAHSYENQDFIIKNQNVTSLLGKERDKRDLVFEETAENSSDKLDPDIPHDVAPEYHSTEDIAVDITDKYDIAVHQMPNDDIESGVRKQYVAMDAKNPDFLAHFFANSRLHHLSTWKADLRAKFVRLVASKASPRKSGAVSNRIIMHIDFDCFFATISALAHPNLDINKDPIAVSHGGKSSDVASCNYVARAKGVSNGMWLGTAKTHCPELNVLDYDFVAYESASNKFYNYLIGKNVFDTIFPVLIDEVLVDVTSFCNQGDIVKNVESLSLEIRLDIYKLTKCPVSIGASKNVLLAKLATRKAKPRGQFYLYDDIESFLDDLTLKDLPGVGRGLTAKLAEEMDCGSQVLIRHVKSLPLDKLIRIFGEKTGSKIFQNCRGIDTTSISLDFSSVESLLGRKSVSVDVNYGIRFDTFEQVETFLMNLSKELYKRLSDLKLCGSSLTLKLAKRHPNAPVNPPKYMGMGLCTFLSKSSRLGIPTNDWGIVGSEIRSLYRMLNVPPQELRGIAISMTKLQDIEQMKSHRQRTLEFNRAKNMRRQVKANSQEFPFAEPVSNAQSIDWAVFNQLPDAIRNELKKELLRRGIPVSAREKSPTKRSPVKTEGQKVYIQQLFPTQPDGPFKSTRVIESPKKRKRLKTSPTKSILPIKRENSPTPFNDTVSYDQGVLDELPSTIQREFFAELEWQRKNKKLATVPMKERFKQIQVDENTVTNKEINLEWLNGQNRLTEYGEFANMRNFAEIQSQVTLWARLSLRSQGPHVEDIKIFSSYIDGLIALNNINRCLLLLRLISHEVNAHQYAITLCPLSSQEKQDYLLGLKDWQKFYEQFRQRVISACSQRKIIVDI